jgi:sugar lactone lactonase YvrE
MSAETKEFRHCTDRLLNFPESIDMDQEGNLYLSDALEGSLYRFKRRADGTLDSEEELVLCGLKSAHGISISADNVLYVGVTVGINKAVQPKIIALSLEVFDACTDLPRTYETLKACAEERGYLCLEHALPKGNTPNGVIWAEKEQAVYYTVERLGAGLLGCKGRVERVPFGPGQEASEILKRVTPNGIDLDRSAETPTLIVALSLRNAVCRIELSPGGEARPTKISLGKGGPGLWGHIPDGLLCLDSGDVLVASFASGEILCLPRKGGAYGNSFPVSDRLGHATDLVYGPSSSGCGNSLFVTAMRPLGKGRVIEIPDIEDVIEGGKQER